ncbi:MAG TPA: hypothetical protein VH092_28235 [Urbifossiella sp.]|jgi:hypothetical protein|nr:hypothetical protein [Urbifossiella sp.]
MDAGTGGLVPVVVTTAAAAGRAAWEAGAVWFPDGVGAAVVAESAVGAWVVVEGVRPVVLPGADGKAVLVAGARPGADGKAVLVAGAVAGVRPPVGRGAGGEAVPAAGGAVPGAPVAGGRTWPTTSRTGAADDGRRTTSTDPVVSGTDGATVTDWPFSDKTVPPGPVCVTAARTSCPIGMAARLPASTRTDTNPPAAAGFGAAAAVGFTCIPPL